MWRWIRFGSSFAEKLLKHFKSKRRPKDNKHEKSFDKYKSKAKSSSSKNKSKNNQCYNCKKYGHIASECPTKVKLKRKGLVANATWGDSSESKFESNESRHGENESYPILMASTTSNFTVAMKQIVKLDVEASEKENEHEDLSDEDDEEEL